MDSVHYTASIQCPAIVPRKSRLTCPILGGGGEKLKFLPTAMNIHTEKLRRFLSQGRSYLDFSQITSDNSSYGVDCAELCGIVKD